MLLREDGDAVIAIGQAGHAWISGQLARAWGRPVPHPLATQLAAEQHDVGMAEWDLTPDLDPATGRPVPFTRMALETHLALWSAAPERLLTQSVLSALLVSLHGTRLYELRDLSALDPDQADDVRAYLAAQRALQERLARLTGIEWEVLREQQDLLSTWDWLSLGLCLDWAPAGYGGLELKRLDDGAHTLDPWPLASDDVLVFCEGRRLSSRASSAPELHAMLEGAEVVPLRFALRRR